MVYYFLIIIVIIIIIIRALCTACITTAQYFLEHIF